MKIIFIGLSGSGKSTFGAFVSQILNMPFIDTDADICKKYGEITAIFKSGGEGLFRSLESHEMQVHAATDEPAVIALGGGAVLNEQAMKELKRGNLVVYLYCESEVLARRLEGDSSRPLLAGGDLQAIEAMLEKRDPLYLKYADIVLNESGILKSRNIEDSPLEDQLGAMYVELVNALEKKIYKDRKS